MADYLYPSHAPTKIILDRLKFGTQTRISRQVLESARISTWEDIVTEQLVVALEAEVLAEKLTGDTTTVSRSEYIPANWWDYLKRDVWYTDLDNDRIMRWIAKRWPVRWKTQTFTVTVKLERYAKFPHATIALPELGRPVIFEQWGEPNWRVDGR